MASKLEESLAAAVKEGRIPQAIVYATNKDSEKEGFQHYGVDNEPIQEDALLMLASQTKLLTVIAALKAVELGLIGLDDDVATHLPELAEKKILTGFDDDDKPILKGRTKSITLRLLLTHSSGACYDAVSPHILKYIKQKGLKLETAGTIVDRYDIPLLFEPGESWIYGPGLDWTGLLIQRLSKMTLEEFEHKHLWSPLGVTGITFWPYKNPAFKDKVPQLVIRGEDGKLAPSTEDHLNTHSVECFGGHGGYARMSDYLQVQRSLLANDGKLLPPPLVDEIFRPQLSEGSKAGFTSFRDGFGGFLIGEHPTHIPVDYGLGGMIFMADDDGRRKKGTMSWGGLTNPFWLIDREAGLALTFGIQILPPGDVPTKQTIGVVERAIYSMAGVTWNPPKM